MEDVDRLIAALHEDRIRGANLASSLSADNAADLVARLKAEADRHWFIDANQSLCFASYIIEIGRVRQDSASIALGTMARGDALGILGQVDEAWTTLGEAGALYAAIGDEIGWARTRIGRLHLSIELKQVAVALADAERAAEIFRRHQDLDKLLRLKLNTAAVHNFLGEYYRAVDLFHEALRLCDALGEAGERYRGAIHLNLGYAFNFIADFPQAEAHYETAYRLLEQRGESSGMTMAVLNRGYLAFSQRRYRSALQLLHQAVDHAGETMPRESALARQAMVEVYLQLNRYEKACALAADVIASFRIIHGDYGLARNLLNYAVGLAQLGENEAAYAALDEAQAIYSRLQASPWLGRVALQRGQMLLHAGDYQVALRAARQAADCFAACGAGMLWGEAMLLSAQIQLALGAAEQAAGLANEVLRQARSLHDPLLRYGAHLLLGRIHQGADQPERAIRRYALAVALVERVQRELTITMRSGFLADKEDALRSLIQLHLDRGNVEEAFGVLERSKAQVWLRHVLNRERLHWRVDDDPRTQQLVEELEALRAGHHAYTHLLYDPAEDGSRVSLSPEQIRDELDRLEQQMRDLTEQLYLRAGGGDTDPFYIPTLSDIQAHLGEREALLAYFSSGCNWWVFVVRHNSITARELPAESMTIRQLIEQVQGNVGRALRVGASSPVTRALSQLLNGMLIALYEALIAPIAPLLYEIDRLTIVPYGDTHYLPLHLLYDGAHHLIERRELVVLPVAALLTREIPSHPPGALVLAHSAGGRLPQTQSEVEVIGQYMPSSVFVEAQASRSRLRQPPRQILHVAAHGRQQLDRPELSYIELADGRLYTDDLLQNDLSYELVVFSGCETGRTRVAPGEELIGLGRGILYAGAGAFIASLWPVEDALTVGFMAALYTNLAGGLSKAAALRDAQITIKAAHADLHPAYWGAFQLVGSPRPLSGVR